MPRSHPRLAHYGRYDRTAADVAFGDSLEATERAAQDGYKGIDKNLLSTSDLVPIVNHSPVLSSFLGGKFTHRWSGPEWGEGALILDPNRDKGTGSRTWADVALVTDVEGKRRIRTLEEHVADGVAKGVIQYPESKSQDLQERPEFWANVRDVMERHGHPLVMMALSDYGHPVRRFAAAKANGFHTAVLPRGNRPVQYLTTWAPVLDAVWGTAWNPLPT